MIDPSLLYENFRKNGIDFFVGVPDSLLKELNNFIEKAVSNKKNITAANEGNAIAIATGYHLATKKIPLVYMQNSGLGNCINPLTSLTNESTYRIPMVLLIGWRGEPGYTDEPQHLMPGKILKKQLKLLDIKTFFLNKNTDAKTIVGKVINETVKNSLPVALVVSKNTFSPNLINKKKTIFKGNLSRYDAIKYIATELKDDIVIATTGKASRELYEIRKADKQSMHDFLTVGSMGHVSSIAMGVALGQEQKNVICIDGDGSLLMHMGSMGVIGDKKIKNIKHFVINNGCHESVGGQISAGSTIDFCKIAKACRYTYVKRCENMQDLKSTVKESKGLKGPVFIEVYVNNDSARDLGRPKESPIENKKNFVNFLSKKSDD